MLSCLRHIPEIFQDIEKVLIFYFDKEKSQVESRYLSKDDNYSNYLELDFSEAKSYINNMRQTTEPAGWFAQDELIFELKKEEKFENKKGKQRQLKLLSEDKKTILRLTYENESDKKSDLLFIYFNSLLNILPVSSSKKSITPDDKSIIQSIVYKTLKVYIKNAKENKIFFENVSKSTQSILNEKEKYKKRVELVNEKYGQMLLNQCNTYLRKIENTNIDMPRFEFSDESKAKIKSYNGRLEELERIIANAAWSSANFFFNKEENKILIHDSMLIFDKSTEKISEELKETGFDEVDSKKYYNIISMLNKYEAAALSALKLGEKKIKLQIIGDNCKPHHCSGAAVSDFINKYIDDISILYEKYPNNWPTIKKHLKSIYTKIVIPSMYTKIKNA